MKNKIFGLILTLALLFSFTGCGTLSKIFHKNSDNETEITISTPNMYQVKHEYNVFQVDSMCVVDTLPRNFDGWLRSAFLDYETNQYIVRYMYIKELNNNYEMIYIVTPKGEMYVVSKRKVVAE